jgi:hypothetical protein
MTSQPSARRLVTKAVPISPDAPVTATLRRTGASPVTVTGR